MKTDRIDISVIMACRNEAAHIRDVLESVLSQEEVPGQTREILIADGMSDDGTREILEAYQQRFPELHILANPGKIVSTGLNAAIQASRGGVILRMDAHTEYAPDYIRRCVEILDASGADNVGGPARTKSRGWLGKAIAAAYHSRFACGGARFHDEDYEGLVDTVPYGCWKRSTFERVGFFDEELVRNQDDEFNLRVVRAGGKIWQSPAIVSWYSPRSSLASLFRQYFQYGFWKVHVVRKHRLPASWRHLMPAMFVLANLLLPLGTIAASLFDLRDLSGMLLWTWAGALGLYTAVSVLAAYATARSNRDSSLLPILPLVFLTYHFSYGLGFLISATRLLSGRGAARAGKLATELSR